MSIYSPILRKSPAEINALSHVYSDSKSQSQKLLPIIQYSDFSDINQDSDKFFKVIEKFGNYLQRNIGTHEFILSLSPALNKLADDDEVKLIKGQTLISLIITNLNKNNLNYTLMINYDSSDWILNELSKISFKKMWISFTPYTFDSGVDSLVIDGTYQKFSKLLHNCELNFQADFYTSLSDFARIHSFINKLSHYDASVILTVTSCPADANGVPHSQFTRASTRTDFSIFQSLQTEFPELIFSDYTVRLKPEPSDVEKHGMNINNTYLKFFYTTADSYFIGKSGLIKQIKAKKTKVTPTNKPHKTDKEICADIVQSKVYDGKSFSFGDNFLYKVSQGTKEINSHYAPILIGINHHITRTLDQL